MHEYHTGSMFGPHWSSGDGGNCQDYLEARAKKRVTELIDHYGLIEQASAEELTKGDIVLCVNKSDPTNIKIGLVGEVDTHKSIKIILEKPKWLSRLGLPNRKFKISRSQGEKWRFYSGSGDFTSWNDLLPYLSTQDINQENNESGE